MTKKTQNTKQANTRRAARKRKVEDRINQSAESVTGLSPLVGVNADDLRNAVTTTIRNLVKQPSSESEGKERATEIAALMKTQFPDNNFIRDSEHIIAAAAPSPIGAHIALVNG